jgi:hypothetical protein
LKDVLGAKVSLGAINNILKKVALDVRSSYEEVQAHVPEADVINVDESSFNKGVKRLYASVFDTAEFAFYKIMTRSAYVLENCPRRQFSWYGRL